MSTSLHTSSPLWLTDIHLDRASASGRDSLYNEIRKSESSTLVVTGDISTAKLLPLHLRELAAAALGKKVYFVLGNHDFYGSGFEVVDRCVAGVCSAHDNLQHLGNGEIIRLDEETALIGHRGWGDGRMGWGVKTLARNPDFDAIEDFQGLNRNGAFDLLGKLGRESAAYFRQLLPYALTCYRHVIVATHVPPFTWAAKYDHKPCDFLRQPFYTNISAGAAIMRIAERFLASRITVLCGHTHRAATVPIADNLAVLTGGAKLGAPQLQGALTVSDGLIKMHSP